MADNARRFYHYDESGNTTLLTDDGGALTDAYAIGPYGEVAARQGASENPFVFRGSEGVMEMGGGLHYMRARWYDAATGRFLSRDPLPGLQPRRRESLRVRAGQSDTPLGPDRPMARHRTG